MPAVAAMTMSMLRRVPAGVEQSSRSVPVRIFLDQFKIGQLSAASADQWCSMKQPSPPAVERPFDGAQPPSECPGNTTDE
jgi:hypothetical protein